MVNVFCMCFDVYEIEVFESITVYGFGWMECEDLQDKRIARNKDDKHWKVMDGMWWRYKPSKLCNCEGLNRVWVSLGRLDYFFETKNRNQNVVKKMKNEIL